jgi:mRNA-degrading endonuclease YafQ of YafQ-DinJ toxin-antitoxin module
VRRALVRTTAFVRAARRYLRRHPEALASLQETLALLEADAFDARLRTHKLKGDLAGSWACSGGYDLRIVFEFVQHEGADAVLLVPVGTHDEVY